MSGRRPVLLAPRAEADLEAIVTWIAEHGAPLAAIDYVQRIQRFIADLDRFPERGARHDEIKRGLRLIGFRRRVEIAFVVQAEWIEVERIFYGGQDWERALREDSDDPAD